MHNQTARRATTLSNVALSILLIVSLLTATSHRTQAQAQTQPPPPAAVPAAVSPAAPAPSAAVAAVIADAQAKVKAGQFAEAVAALTAAKTDGLTLADKEAIDFSIANAQRVWGNALIQTDRFAEAPPHFEVAIAVDRTYTSRRDTYCTDLLREGVAYSCMSQYEKAITCYEQALAINRETKNRDGEADVLDSLGTTYSQMSQYEKAITYHEQALTIYHEVKDRNGEARTLNGLGSDCDDLSQYEKAIGYYEQALPIYREVKDRNGEASTLTNLGNAYNDLSQCEKAISYFEQALPIFQIVNRDFEGNTLIGLGTAYNSLSQYEKAIGYYEKALTIYREVKDPRGEASAINGLGIDYVGLSQYEKAIRYYNQALAIDRRVRDPNSEADALTSLGVAYRALSQYEEAIGFYKQALPIFREIQDQSGEAGTLNNLGGVYDNLSQYEKSIGCYERALSIFRKIKDPSGEAETLNSLGNALEALSQYEKSIGCYEQALAICWKIKDRNGAANALTNLGNSYRHLSQYEKAISFCEQALPIFQQVKDRDHETNALSGLALAWSNAQNPGRNSNVAILFGKEAVNVLQSIRSDIHGMDKATQQGFAKSKAGKYRTLADLLIAQHRLPEALQVLDLLKQEEYLNFSKPVPGKAIADSLLAKAVDLTPREARWDKALKAYGDIVADDAARKNALEDQQQPTPQQKQQMAALTSKVASDKAEYQKTLADLTADFRSKPDPVQNRLGITSNARDLQAALRTIDHGSVALYTLVTDKNIDLLLVTPNRLVARTVSLSSPAELDHKIAAFRAVLQDPYSDPRPLGKMLYDKLIAPIKHDLVRAHTKTLLVSLDGNLRYIPLAALSPDGKKHYLVETYRTALYTPAAIANLARNPNPHWTALAMGVSQPHEGFKELNAVPGELRAVARTNGEGGPDAGLFPGTRLLDAAFTQKAMLSALHTTGNGGGYPLVHIASHFVFSGDESTSFLLLGDGTHLTLSDMKLLPDGIFSGINLLTLSACETATGSLDANNNGSRDVENVAVLAQRKGADAVLASLWSVNDSSTGQLMRTFYRSRQAGGETKADALREAQIALLTGGTKPAAGNRGTVSQKAKCSEFLNPAQPSSSGAEAPAFKPDLSRPWAHPFYWAPFILIGNWK